MARRYVLYGLVDAPGVLLVASALLGVGNGLAMPSLTVMIGGLVTEDGYGRATSLQGTAMFAGQFIPPLLAGPLITATSYATGRIARELAATNARIRLLLRGGAEHRSAYGSTYVLGGGKGAESPLEKAGPVNMAGAAQRMLAQALAIEATDVRVVQALPDTPVMSRGRRSGRREWISDLAGSLSLRDLQRLATNNGTIALVGGAEDDHQAAE